MSIANKSKLFLSPSPYRLWSKYIGRNEVLKAIVGVDSFADDLERIGAIKKFKMHSHLSGVQCEIINEELIYKMIKDYSETDYLKILFDRLKFKFFGESYYDS